MPDEKKKPVEGLGAKLGKAWRTLTKVGADAKKANEKRASDKEKRAASAKRANRALRPKLVKIYGPPKRKKPERKRSAPGSSR